MLLSEVVEEIIEKSPSFISMPSIVRKVNQARDEIIRTYGDAIVSSSLDLLTDIPEYPLPCYRSNVVEVVVDGETYPESQLGPKNYNRYYYFLKETIGLYPTPTADVVEGLVIFHRETRAPLSISAMDEPAGLNDFDMLLVYKVLRTSAPEVFRMYQDEYERLLDDYRKAHSQQKYVTEPGW